MNSGTSESPQHGGAYSVKDQNLFYKGKDEKEKSSPHRKVTQHLYGLTGKSMDIHFDFMYTVLCYTHIVFSLKCCFFFLQQNIFSPEQIIEYIWQHAVI